MQAIFIKSADPNPTCDLHHLYCGENDTADAYISEQHLGNILRYLKCCTLDSHGVSTGQPRYPNLKQVFVTSRTYGGYASGAHGCLNPEPFAYEEGFAVQRLILSQINRTADGYSGNVRYPEDTPWVDWGPYLWASGVNQSPGSGLIWCDSTTKTVQQCQSDPGDFRYGDLDPNFLDYWGDHTHPTASGAEKVANQLVKFIQGNLGGPQQSISNWVTPWMQK